MPESVASPRGPRQAPNGAQIRTTDPSGPKTADFRNLLRILRRLIDAPAEAGYPHLRPRTHEELAAEMTEGGYAVGRPYVTQVLNEEKPLHLRFTEALPLDLRKALHTERLREFGALVVEPAPTTGSAVQQLVSGLLRLLAEQDPERPAVPLRMARAATLPEGVLEDRRRRA